MANVNLISDGLHLLRHLYWSAGSVWLGVGVLWWKRNMLCILAVRARKFTIRQHPFTV